MSTKALVVFSGGQDSTTCLYWAFDHFDEVHALSINYGQRHSIELQAAAQIAGMAGDQLAGYDVVDIGKNVLKGTSPLTNPDEELEQYADAASLPGGLEKTFVPMRNQLFLTIAANRAFVLGCSNLVTGVCQEDFGGYPDCRQPFIDAFVDTTNEGTFTQEAGAGMFAIHTPLMNKTKAQAVEMACGMTGCYKALQWSHTAYDGKFPPTGKDHASLLRASGFEKAMVPDPLVLRAHLAGKMELPDTPNYGKAEVALYSSLLV